MDNEEDIQDWIESTTILDRTITKVLKRKIPNFDFGITAKSMPHDLYTENTFHPKSAIIRDKSRDFTIGKKIISTTSSRIFTTDAFTTNTTKEATSTLLKQVPNSTETLIKATLNETLEIELKNVPGGNTDFGNITSVNLNNTSINKNFHEPSTILIWILAGVILIVILFGAFYILYKRQKRIKFIQRGIYHIRSLKDINNSGSSKANSDATEVNIRF